jgi:hypothetical protein
MSERALDLATDALAVKRLTRLVTEDVILEPVRNAIWSRFGGPENGTGLGYFITCPHCTSVWIAAGVQTARIMFPRVWSPISRALALSAVTSILAERE